MAGRAAVVAVDMNPGRIVLFGLRPQHRAQTHATFPMLFNALYLAAAAGSLEKTCGIPATLSTPPRTPRRRISPPRDNPRQKRGCGVCRPMVGSFAIVALVLAAPLSAGGQGLTGTLIGTVRDEQGGAIRGADVAVSSPALIGGTVTQITNEKGQLRFPALPPGLYTMEVRFAGFATAERSRHRHRTRARRSSERSCSCPRRRGDGAGGRRDVPDRRAGSGVRYAVRSRGPARRSRRGRSSMFDALRNVPGVSATSPSSGTATTISAFGSGTNENQFLIDGTNTTCPCNGVARSEPGVDFIQEIQVQAVGASAEFGNVQGAVINVITRQGSERFLFDTSYYAQPQRLTSQPVRLRYDGGRRESGYSRARYRDYTSNIGGPASAAGSGFSVATSTCATTTASREPIPACPRTYEQNKLFAKLTWRLAPGLAAQSELPLRVWVSPEQPRVERPIETTSRHRQGAGDRRSGT